MDLCRKKTKGLKPNRFIVLGAAMVLTVAGLEVFGQDGLAGINEANTKVRSYFDAGTNLMYAVGALLGLIGAVKV